VGAGSSGAGSLEEKEGVPSRKQQRLDATALQEALRSAVSGRAQRIAEAQAQEGAQGGSQGAQGRQGGVPGAQGGQGEGVHQRHTAGEGVGIPEMHLVEVGLHLLQRGFLAIDLESILGAAGRRATAAGRRWHSEARAQVQRRDLPLPPRPRAKTRRLLCLVTIVTPVTLVTLVALVTEERLAWVNREPPPHPPPPPSALRAVRSPWCTLGRASGCSSHRLRGAP